MIFLEDFHTEEPNVTQTFNKKIKKSWINKYNPKCVSDLYLPEPLLLKLSNLLQNKNLPNMLITGGSGTGKTCSVKLMAEKIYGKYYNDAVLELNASDNRGLEILNNSIIYFCKKKLNDDLGNPIIKLVIMDEADNITKKAQNMVSNFMEEYSNNTNFIFTCNDSNKLIESIQSRCFIMYYPYISYTNIILCLKKIAEKEHIDYEKEALELIAKNAHGDLRQAISIMEMIYYGRKRLIFEDTQLLSHQPKSSKLVDLIKCCTQRNLSGAIAIINELKNEGYCGSDILLNINNTLNTINIDEDVRLKYIKHISKAYIDVLDGIDTNLQLYRCLSEMVLI